MNQEPMEPNRIQLAMHLFEEAYRLQMEGELDLAARMYCRSLEAYPTAEAHTFLGWTYRFQGKIDDAIVECKKAIALDPAFGNPYNDIGAYLIDKGEFDEAVTWLEKAVSSPRYDSYHYPWYNLGRIWMAKEMYRRASECFQQAIDIEPDYSLARQAMERVRRMIH
jgi:Tfp pilus assembly protein PilF